MASACAIWVYSLGDSARGCVPQAEPPTGRRVLLSMLSRRITTVALVAGPRSLALDRSDWTRPWTLELATRPER